MPSRPGWHQPLRTFASDAPTWALTAYPIPWAEDLSAQPSSESSPLVLTLLGAAGHTVPQQSTTRKPVIQLIGLPAAVSLPPAPMVRVQQNGRIRTMRVVRQ
ncbi:hypothetical protein [Hymenobacter sp. PAMC 26628]|uniref:hypothetical protein n=1 Tax=Hymenobacter sp. PAMC 26628 TaxID=1484118 RepID=UPI0012FF972D|nr:hypothetical protein [Hymenobacter sp. PAMC 26628]